MARIDAHQHFWRFNARRDTWISEDMSTLRRDFLPGDLESLLREKGIDGCIAVQADQSHEETDALLHLAAQHSFVKGVVGWVDLLNPDLMEQLQKWRGNNRLCGFRHILQAEEASFMLRQDFLKGIHTLTDHGFTYDLLVKPHQLEASFQLVKQCSSSQVFIIDHLAKPLIAEQKHAPWAQDMKKMASYPNVYCKLSGMVTEANWTGWKPSDFTFYIHHLLEVFGPERLLFGSDWPVCLLGGSYGEVVDLLESHLGNLSVAEQQAIWGGNAERIYKLTNQIDR